MDTIEELREYIQKTSDIKTDSIAFGECKTSFGCDPELFVCDANSGKLRSSIGLINAGKKDPKQMAGMENGFMIQEDNVALEYNIPPQSTSTFGPAVRSAREWIKWEILRPNNLSISIKASEIFPEEELQDPKAREFGCDPDFNVYEQQDNPRPNARNKNLRSAGGHIHIGAGYGRYAEYPEHIQHAYGTMFAKLLDVTVGNVLAEYDDDSRRMKLYGTPGSIRFKPYGIEYRTPSNFWSLLAARDINLIAAQIANVDCCLAYAATVDHLKEKWFTEMSKFYNYALELAPISRAAIATGDKKLIKEINDDISPKINIIWDSNLSSGLRAHIGGMLKKDREDYLRAAF